MPLRDSQLPHEQSLSRACRGDAELIQRAAYGDTEAFVRLYIMFVPALRRFFTKHGADRELCTELVQRTLVHLWTERADFHADTSFDRALRKLRRNLGDFVDE